MDVILIGFNNPELRDVEFLAEKPPKSVNPKAT